MCVHACACIYFYINHVPQTIPAIATTEAPLSASPALVAAAAAAEIGLIVGCERYHNITEELVHAEVSITRAKDLIKLPLQQLQMLLMHHKIDSQMCVTT